MTTSLMPYEEELQVEPGLLGRLGRVGLSGVAAVGNVLDLPGSTVRDVLAMQNPLDQWLPWNWTSSENRTSGRGLLRQYGLVGKDDTYANWWGGFGAEIALDPLTYLGAGALLKGAQAGTTGIKGLARASIPFTKTGVEIGTGARAEQIAKGIGLIPDMLTKPSKLAPVLENAAKYLPGAKVAAGGDEAAEGIRFFEKGKPPSPAAHRRTLSTEMLQREADKLTAQYDALDPTDPAFNDVMAELDELNRILKERAAGSQPTSLDALLKASPGTLHRTDIPATNINDIESIVPKNLEPPTADWAKRLAEAATFPGRAAMGLFHAPVRGKFGEESQRVAKAQWERIGKAQQQALEEATAFVDDYHEIEKGVAEIFGEDIKAALPKDLSESLVNVNKAVRDTTEMLFGQAAETDDVLGAMKELSLDPAKATPQLLGKIGSLGRRMKDTNKRIYESYLEMGGKGEVLPKLEGDEMIPEMAEIGSFPGFEHFPRFGAEHPDNVMAAIRGGLTRAEGSAARLEPLRAVPRLIVERIGKLTQGMMAEGLSESQIAKSIEDKFGKWLNKELDKARPLNEGEELVEGAKVSVDAAGNTLVQMPKWGSAEKHAQSLAKWATNADNYATYLNDNLKAESRYLRGMLTATANIGGIYDVVKATIGRRPLVAAVEGVAREFKQLRGLADLTEYADGIPLVPLVSIPQGQKGLFDMAEMDVERSLKWLAKQLGDDSDEAIARLRDHGAVPKEVAEAIAGSRKVSSHPEWARTVAAVMDVPTRWFKENVTLPFASFAARNLASGQYLNAASGVLESIDDLKLYSAQVRDLFEMWRTNGIPKELEREWFTQGVLGQDMLFEGVETRGGTFAQAAPDSISPLRAWQEAGEQIEPSFLDRIPGLRSVRQTHGAVLGTGSHVNRVVEFLNRVPLYETLKRKGWSPEEAAKKVAQLQIDYGHHNFSPFENDVLRRLFPFYAWQRKIGPVILGSLARNPAGPVGQSIRASRLASSNDPTMPEWMGETLAIENPLGSSEPGGKSYITGLGLPYEGPLAYFGGGLRGAGREVLSQLNPLIKAPLEWSTGTSFFQGGPSGGGRPLDEMNPPVGQTLANIARFAGRDPSTPVPTPALAEFAVANSPLSRYATTARQLTDPRKHPLSTAANMLTGVRVTDVSPSAQDAILRGRANALMREMGAREFRQTYFPANAPAADQDTASSLRELLNELGRRQRQRKAAMAVQ